MSKLRVTVIALVALAGCQSTIGTVAVRAPVAAGYADGTKDVYTDGLIFSATSKTFRLNSGGTFDLQNYDVYYRNPSDPNQLIAIVNSEEIVLTYSAGNGYQGSNSTHNVAAYYSGSTSDAQVELGFFLIANTSTGETYGGYVAAGLPTNPVEVAALSGSATYTGTAKVAVLHDTGGAIAGSAGTGTATITANFPNGIVSGSMAITDDGTSDAGYALMPTTIFIDPTTISGNGFTTTLSATANDLAMNSISSSALEGTFFGLNAADVGGTFSAQGVSIDGTSPAFITGGFIGE